MTSSPDIPALKNGTETIRRALRDMPTLPGVYRMLDKNGTALYVGKAKHLKNRVGSYVNTSAMPYRLLRMVSQVESVEVTTTHTEAEALLLEANLIKKLQPRYNVLLRDDKSFPYIFLSGDHDFPRISKYRGPQKQKGEYFGPFASAGAAAQTVTTLQRAFLLRPCSDNIFKGRTRPCLQYQIKRCSAPCVNYVNKEQYADLMAQARAFLTGKSRDIQDRLTSEMQQASEQMDYEKAALLRDRIRALTQVQQEQRFHATSFSDADVMAMHREGGKSCIQVFFFRAGQNYGNRAFFPSHSAEEGDGEILSAFIGQFYQRRTPPKLILTSHSIPEAELIEAALLLNSPVKVSIQTPQRGEKLNIIQQALENAKRALEWHLAERTSQKQLLEGVTTLFDLEETPTRIEVYDNSHISGTHAVGAMIVAGPEGFEKKHYRTFNIRTADLAPGDDYAMLREVLTRRFTRLQKEDPERGRGLWPDLLLIDGGAGQLSVATEVLEEMGISDLSYAAIAKGPDRNAGREQFFVPGKASFQLLVNDPVLHYLQRLRDEAHRFAIGTHRNKRSKAIQVTTLDDIPGIGGTRKKALLHHFGSGKAVQTASVAELQTVPGISKKTALAIYDFFHS